MKLLTTSALALCLLVLVGCAEGTSPAPSTAITEATNKVEAKVEGMTCTGCTGQVVSAVEGIKGVKECHADVKTGAVQVALTDGADAEAAKAEIETVIAGLSDGKYTVSTIAVAEQKECAEGCADKAEGEETKSCPADCTKDCCKKA